MYSIDNEGNLTELLKTPYPLEAHLQKTIATHPALLAGDQMNSASPRRFVLVTEEAGVPMAEASGDAFSLDVLLLDQDAIPTLVEVKRSSDTRIRREVIGQLIEYAANVCSFLSADRFRAAYEQRAISESFDPAAYLAAALGVPESEYETFWGLVQSNLNQQRLRLVLAADEVPEPTRRIIEFMNRQMTATDVYAVAITQHANDSVRTLTSRLLNPSLRDNDRRSSWRPGVEWTRERFYEALLEAQPRSVSVARAIDEWATAQPDVRVEFGNGTRAGSLIFVLQPNADRGPYQSGRDVVFLTLWTYGSIEVPFQYLSRFGEFQKVEVRAELLRRLNEIGCDISTDKLERRPSIPFAILQDTEYLHKFLDVQQWLLMTARQSSGGALMT